LAGHAVDGRDRRASAAVKSAYVLYHFEDYRDILQQRFDERHARNPSYSLRAFARDLRISPSRLCEVLGRNHHLSARMADDIAQRLDLGDEERAFFRDLVDSQAGRTAAVREQARARLVKFRFEDDATKLRMDQFRAISDWYHFAILELFKTRDFRDEAGWIGRTLGIGEKTAKDALARLTRLGFVEVTPTGYALRRSRSVTDSDLPSPSLRDFHRQILERAAFALHSQTKAERVSLAAVAAMDVAQLPALRAEINALVGKFAVYAAKQADADHVYGLTVQLFKLDEGGDDFDALA
jgi:uncharacterized protein (TIGR02147 family)